MKFKAWTEEEVKRLHGLETDAEIAVALGRSSESVSRKRRRLRSIPNPNWVSAPAEVSVANLQCIPTPAEVAAALFNQGEPQETTYHDDRKESDNGVWRSQFERLQKKYEKALLENSVTQALVDDIRSLAPVSYASAPAIYRLRPESSSSSQSAVLLFSDTHVGKVVVPEQTLNFGSYNFQTFLARLKYLEESIASILENHTTTVIDELVIAMLGDMLDGALLHSVEAGQHVTLFSQFYAAGHAIAQFFRALATRVPKIRVQTCVGNHTRWGTQKRMPTENRFSNLDMFLYALVEALTKDIPNIEWDLNMQPFSLFEVQGFLFHGSHGDHLRGGDKALGIPNHAVGRNISVTSQLFGKHGRQTPHYYVCGHLHREITLPHANGQFIINGGFPGFDNYGLMESFNPVDPSQRFFFVHPKFGKTAEYSLSLKFAEVTEGAPYSIPSQFAIG